MEPKDKARELVERFKQHTMDDSTTSKEAINCALICVEEIKHAVATSIVLVDRQKENKGIDDIIDTDYILHDCCIPYWLEVQTELKLMKDE